MQICRTCRRTSSLQHAERTVRHLHVLKICNRQCLPCMSSYQKSHCRAQRVHIHEVERIKRARNTSCTPKLEYCLPAGASYDELRKQLRDALLCAAFAHRVARLTDVPKLQGTISCRCSELIFSRLWMRRRSFQWRTSKKPCGPGVNRLQ